MKKIRIKILYRLFAYLSDKTNGFAPFVKYKLTLGALLIGIGACSNPTGKTQSVTTIDDEDDQETETPTCYEQILPPVISDTSAEVNNIEKSSEKKINKNEIIPVEEIEPMIITCYDVAVVPEEPDVVQTTDEIFRTVDTMPHFPGGEKALTEFIQKNLRYPETDTDVQGRVVIRFVVEKDGEISNIEILRSLASEFDKEAVRIIQLMPKWVPGKQNGKPARVYYTLPIRFIP